MKNKLTKLAVAFGMFVSARALAADPFVGPHQDDAMLVTLKPAGDGKYVGSIVLRDAFYLIEDATLDGTTLKGKFETAEERSFDFTATAEGSTIKFASGAKTRTLTVPQRNGKPFTDDESDMPGVLAASKAMDDQKWDDAASLVKPLIDNNNIRALYLAGLLYSDGHGFAKDINKAMEMYDASGSGGFSSAYLNLGVLLRDTGEGHFKAARGAFARAATLGNSQALLNFGVLYAKAQGGPEDDVRADALYLCCPNEKFSESNRASLEKEMKQEQLDAAKELADSIRLCLLPTSAADSNGGVPVTFEKAKEGYVVKSVAPGNADFESVQPGDVLVDIDGKPVADLSEADLAKLLAGPVGSSIQLHLTRAPDSNIQLAVPRVALK